MIERKWETWWLTKIGRESFVQINVAGPLDMNEMVAFKRFVDMIHGWWVEDAEVIGHALVAWGEAMRSRSEDT